MRCLKTILCLLCMGLASKSLSAQQVADSAGAASSLTMLLQLCSPKASPHSVPATTAAQYILYRGDDRARRWKSFCNARKPGELQYTNQVCNRMFGILQKYPTWTITRYQTTHESEGQWHVLDVVFEAENGEPRRYIFAFLKIAGRYGLGDID